MNYRSELLNGNHDVETFDCQVDSLNSWLRQEALRAQAADTARTYVWTADGEANGTVLAYFSIAPTAIQRQELTGGQAGGYSFSIPGFLLARLALDQALHGRRLGAELLIDALGRIVGAAQTSAGRLVIVDAIDDDAARFYRHHDFAPVKGNPRRLVLKIATVRKQMGLG